MDTVLLPLMRSPRLPQYIDELKQTLADEAVARQRFRDWATPGMKAEFINGEVIVHSPAEYQHNDARSLIERLLGVYVDHRRLGKVHGEKAMIGLLRNDYEPDVCFWGTKKSSDFKPDQTLFPTPDLIVEVLSPSTQKADRGAKFDDYAANGVQEYWLVDSGLRQVEQFVLLNSVFRLEVTASVDDLLRSEVIDGFEASVLAFFDSAANLSAIIEILR